MTLSEAPKVTVLISGKGSNLLSLLEHQGDYRITAVVSNRADATGLEYPEQFGVETVVVERRSFGTPEEFKAGILDAVQRTAPDLVVLAGFMMIVPPAFVHAFPGRIVNIHPSLLPKYPGLNTHQRVLEAGEEYHGCSVHFVDTGIDTGPLVAQAAVRVDAHDTPETLAAKVLTKEHVLYPWCVAAIARGDVTLSGREVSFAPQLAGEADARGFVLSLRGASV